MIPVYIVTGFIGSGKSTFINEQIQHRKKLGGTALISAEEGSVELIKKPLQLDADTLSAISPTNPSSYDTTPKKFGLSGTACSAFTNWKPCYIVKN